MTPPPLTATHRALRLTATAFALLCLTLPAPALAQSVVVNPDWKRKPTFEEIAAHYPRLPLLFGIRGRVLLSCGLNVFGEAVECEVLEETPQEMGFAQAALAVAPHMELIPKTVDGVPRGDGSIQVPLAFKVPQVKLPGARLPTASPARLAAARRLTEHAVTRDAAIRDLLYLVIETLRAHGKELSPEMREAALQAAREAGQAMAPKFREIWTAFYASRYTEAELDAAVKALDRGEAFESALPPRKDKARNAHADALIVEAGYEAGRRLCARFGCVVSSASGPAP